MENENRELQTNNLQPLKTSEEMFIDARRGRKIKFASNEDIRLALRYVIAKLGLRGQNIPKGPAKLLLIDHVFQNFQENTCDEIKLAFDWGIEGRLDEDINCFENFSCLYFTRIMRAYNRLACAVLDKEKKAEELRHLQFEAQERAKNNPKRPDRIEDPEAYEKFLKSGFANILRGKGIQIPGDE